jgi:CheY-like chemotaxis protein
MMAPRILVIDANEAFATMLTEMLEIDGGYQVAMRQNYEDALHLLEQESFDLTILDMDFEAPERMLRQARALWPDMRLMLIPLIGEVLPPEAKGWNIQGTLSKPFFADDLLPTIQHVLARRVQEPPETPASKVSDPQAQAILLELARETKADSVLLVSTRRGELAVVAHASTLREEVVQALAGRSVALVRESRELGRCLGEKDGAFVHYMLESQTLRLYIMALLTDLLLVVAAPIQTPLGTIRHNLRRAERKLVARP